MGMFNPDKDKEEFFRRLYTADADQKKKAYHQELVRQLRTSSSHLPPSYKYWIDLMLMAAKELE